MITMIFHTTYPRRLSRLRIHFKLQLQPRKLLKPPPGAGRPDREDRRIGVTPRPWWHISTRTRRRTSFRRRGTIRRSNVPICFGSNYSHHISCRDTLCAKSARAVGRRTVRTVTPAGCGLNTRWRWRRLDCQVSSLFSLSGSNTSGETHLW